MFASRFFWKAVPRHCEPDHVSRQSRGVSYPGGKFHSTDIITRFTRALTFTNSRVLMLSRSKVDRGVMEVLHGRDFSFDEICCWHVTIDPSRNSGAYRDRTDSGTVESRQQ